MSSSSDGSTWKFPQDSGNVPVNCTRQTVCEHVFMHMCIHAHVHTCTCVCVCVHVFECASMHIHVFCRVCTFLWKCKHACAYTRNIRRFCLPVPIHTPWKNALKAVGLFSLQVCQGPVQRDATRFWAGLLTRLLFKTSCVKLGRLPALDQAGRVPVRRLKDKFLQQNEAKI